MCAQRDITGYYSSNAASLGFFVTRIQLSKDSTFKFEMSGDLAYGQGRGTYKVTNRKIIHLTFNHDSLTTLERALSRGGNKPTKLLYNGGRLYEVTEDGRVLKKGKALSRRKKFLIFGDRYLTTRRLFLKKRKGNLVWRTESHAGHPHQQSGMAATRS